MKPKQSTRTPWCNTHYRREGRTGNAGWVRDPSTGKLRVASDAPKGWPEPGRTALRLAPRVDGEYFNRVTSWWPLPMPVVPSEPAVGWRERAACAGLDVDLFFTGKGVAVPAVEVIAARTACPVRGDCIADGLEAPSDHRFGIRGGLPTVAWKALATRRVQRPMQPCGTPAAYKRHRRNGEQACQACTEANRERQRVDRVVA